MADTIKDTLKDKTLKDLEVVKPSQEVVEVKLTKKKVEEVIELLKDVENNNGHLGIAGKSGLSQSQVKRIHAQMEERIAELKAVEPEVLTK
jgi:transglutaminase/protease-like cytokinesis protein 3